MINLENMVSILAYNSYKHRLKRLIGPIAASISCLMSLPHALGIPAQVPGNVDASNYDIGGQGYGYEDTVGANPGVYRSDGVDLKTSSDALVGTSGYVLGWRTTGEWTNYTINAQAGIYTLQARSESAFNSGKFHINVDGKTVIPSVSVPLTGPWDTASSWKTLTLGTVTLASGSHVVRVYVDAPWFDINYLSFILKSPISTPTPSNAFYINPTAAQGNGSGSSPSNAADASTAGKYAAIVSAQKTPGETIVYAAGTYLTPSSLWIYNNVTHQGAGIDKTIIRQENAAPNVNPGMFWSNGASRISGFKFFDATIDFNTINQTWWTSNSTGHCEGFLFSTADHCTIQRVKFVNMGSKHAESFPIFFNDGYGANGNINHNLIDSCIFTQPVPSGSSTGGLTCIDMSDALPGITVDTTNTVSGNQFLNLDKESGYSDFQYTQCITAPTAINNTATAVDTFWYIEPGSFSLGNNVAYTGVTAQVTGNKITNSGIVAFINMHSNGTYAGNLNVQNNTVGMMLNPYGYTGPIGVKLQNADGSGSPHIGNVTIAGNIFTAPTGSLPVAAETYGTVNVSSLSVLSNTFLGFPSNYTMGDAVRISGVSSYTESGNVF